MLAASLLGTEAWYSNKCMLTWKVKVTKSSRLLFQLHPSTHRTDGTGSGLLQTPEALNHEGYQVANGKKYPRLGAQIGFLQTPVADDAVDRKKGKVNSRGEPKLSGQIAMLPTPRSSGRGGTEKGRDSVDSVIEMGVTKGQIGTKTGLRLQPAFALWMMGYPTDWLDLEAGEMPPSKARATRLSPR